MRNIKKKRKKKGSGMRRLDFNLRIVCHPSLTMTKIRACLVLCCGLFILFCFFKTETRRIFLVRLIYKHILKKYVPKKTVFGKKMIFFSSFFFNKKLCFKNQVFERDRRTKRNNIIWALSLTFFLGGSSFWL